MSADLFINTRSRDRTLYTGNTITLLQNAIAFQFPNSWNKISQRVQGAKNFNDIPIDVKKSFLIIQALRNRDEWIHKSARKTLVDFCTTVIGESDAVIAFSDSDIDVNLNERTTDDEENSDDDVLDF
jgi:hypothetical protein